MTSALVLVEDAAGFLLRTGHLVAVLQVRFGNFPRLSRILPLVDELRLQVSRIPLYLLLGRLVVISGVFDRLKFKQGPQPSKLAEEDRRSFAS